MKSKIYNIICILAGINIAIFGANKLFPFMDYEMNEVQIKMTAAFMTIKWLMPLIGVGEILGGIAIVFRKTRTLGALILFPIVVGIILHGLVIDSAGLLFGVIFLAIVLWIMWQNREKLLNLLK